MEEMTMSTVSKKKTATALETLQTRSANAVSLIRTTIEQLKATNDAIDQEHTSNDNKIAALNTTNASLDTLKADNAKVIANFENLLS
jgi:FtsZ-binding cell division protein ZapB